MKTQYTLQIEDVAISVQRKNIKNLYIRIHPETAEVRLCAPRFMGENDIEAFAASRLDWIRSHREKRMPAPELRYENGDAVFLWGQAYSLRLISKEGKPAVQRDDGEKTITIIAPPSFDKDHRAAVLDVWFREELAAAIPAALLRCEKTTGVHAEEWHIKRMKTRWGSCNVVHRRIWISAALVSKEPRCLDYILTHELTHLYERGHNAVFKAYMDRFFPDWREVRKKLNER